MRELLSFDALPLLQNKVYPNAEAALAASVGDVRLIQDEETGVVSNAAFDASRLDYDQDYQNEQAHSASFRLHLQDVIALLNDHLGTRKVIEVGCGKGYFLNQLQRAGYDALGIDPAYEGRDSNVIPATFSPELGLHAPGIILRHVLEHIPQPLDFLHLISHANRMSGTIYIEVPCLDWIINNRAWFDVFYEHVNYFRLDDLSRFFGDRTLSSGHLFGGQYIYTIARIEDLCERVRRAERQIKFPANFISGIDFCARRLRTHRGMSAVWGASSKGVIFALHMKRKGMNIDAAIDINPVKQGGFMASSGIPIISPELALQSLPEESLVFVMNENYYAEINSLCQGRFQLVTVSQYE